LLTVHHLGSSLSERVVWLCEELALTYTLKRYPREASGFAPAEYKALHPSGTSPTITDGGRSLAETEAVFEYLLTKYGQGRLVLPPDADDYMHYVFWRHYPHGSMMESISFEYMLASIGAVDKEGRLAGYWIRLEKAYAMLEARLADAPFLAGACFTAADIMATYVLTTVRLWIPRDLSSYPNTRAYLQRIGGRPAYRRAIEKAEPGRPFNLL
jgi:glutathione S-transferase